MKTKIALVLLSFGFASHVAYAANASKTSKPVSMDVKMGSPIETGTWSFGGAFVFLQPSAIFQNYLVLTSTSGNTTTTNHYGDGANLKYKGWFNLNLAYNFPGNRYDLQLAYEGLHGSEKIVASASGYAFDQLVPGINTTVHAKIVSTYDALDLTGGLKLNPTQNLAVHPFMGLRYAHIDSLASGIFTYAATDGGSHIFAAPTEGSDSGPFNGIGPRFGSDAQVYFGQHVSLHGRLGLSALVGTSRPNAANYSAAVYNNSTPIQVFEIVNNFTHHTHIVPEVDGRLGLNYSVRTSSKTTLEIEAGWQVVDYLNANVAKINVVPYFIRYCDFGLQGPYASIQLNMG